MLRLSFIALLLLQALVLSTGCNDNKLKGNPSQQAAEAQAGSGPKDAMAKSGESGPEEPLNPIAQDPVAVSGAYLACAPTVEGKFGCYVEDEQKEKQKVPEAKASQFTFTPDNPNEKSHSVSFVIIESAGAPTLFLLDLECTALGKISMANPKVATVALPFSTKDYIPDEDDALLSAPFDPGTWDGVLEPVHFGGTIGDGINIGETGNCFESGKSSSATNSSAALTIEFKEPVIDVGFAITGVCGLESQNAIAVLTGGSLNIFKVTRLLPNSTGGYLLFQGMNLDAGKYEITLHAGPIDGHSDTTDDFGFADFQVLSKVEIKSDIRTGISVSGVSGELVIEP